MNILLLNAYTTDSHSAWCKGLMQHLPQNTWTYLTLPGRHFSWRIRGNALSWAMGEARTSLEKPYDIVVATSMVDLATLRGLVPNLANIPAVVYFHENQFAYPKNLQQHASIEPQMVNLYSALSAQTLLFNSQYNLSSLLDGAAQLLKKLPDQVPPGILKSIEEKSSILPVPINTASFSSGTDIAAKHHVMQPLHIIWNHRWEYDKGPELLQKVIELCRQDELNLCFTIAGLRFRRVPKPFAELLATPRLAFAFTRPRLES